MPLRPFPSSLSIGTDICSIARIKALYERKASGFLRRLFTPRELAIYYSRINYNETIRIPYIAGRWAAKEACIKAVKPRRVTLHQVEIWSPGKGLAPIAVILDSVSDHPVRGPEQETSVGLEENAKEQANRHETEDKQEADVEVRMEPSEVKVWRRAGSWIDLQDIEGQVVMISISHDAGYATAVAIAPEMPELESVAADTGTPASDV